MSQGLIFGNKIVDVVFISTILAQLYKVFSPLLKGKEIEVSKIFSTGSMPSSHSSSTVSLCTSIALIKGTNSIEFAISLLVALITMYDATGIRQEAGKHAKILNHIIMDYKNIKEDEMKELKEFLGHTPLEVVVGAILGFVVAYLMKGYLLT